jgi:hypothetical protein
VGRTGRNHLRILADGAGIGSSRKEQPLSAPRIPWYY